MNRSVAEPMIKAASLQLTGKVEEALAELCGARDAGRGSPKLYCAIGHLQFELRQFEAAAKTYEDAAKLDETDRTAHYNLAVCRERLGEWEQAAAAFGKALEQDPRHTSAPVAVGIGSLNRQRRKV